MGKVKAHKPTLKTPVVPFVSILTPTFNRRPFFRTIIECIRNQTYPKNRMEWVVVDDGTDKIEDLIREARLDPIQIKYIPLAQKVALGKKRNISHEHAKGTIIVYMDDDDYYPPERVEHAVETLEKNPNALCVGSSEIYIYFKHIQKMYQFGPYTPTHATAGTFAFRRQLIEESHYNDEAALAEERAFLKDYTVPFAQLDPLKTILVFSHIHNTFDKKMLLEKPDQMVKLSDKTVEQFIRRPDEQHIKNFFMNEIENLLKDYDPGHPKWKPDVAIQMEQLKREREEMMKKLQDQQGVPQIMINQPGQPPRPLTPNEIVQLLQEHQANQQKLAAENEHLKTLFQKQIQEIIPLKKRIKELETQVEELKQQVISKELSVAPTPTPTPTPPQPVLGPEPPHILEIKPPTPPSPVVDPPVHKSQSETKMTEIKLSEL
jgi:glycosyltransferase involved in cell wall biosynthesis